MAKRRERDSQTPAEMWAIIEIYDQGQPVFITPAYSLVPDDEDFKLH